MRFRIDVYTATSTAAIGGPITEVLGISISEKLNQIGEASITIPAHIASSRGLGRGYRYSVYHETLGYLGQFKHIESSLDVAAETITIKAYDSLIGLAERIAGFRRSFSDQQFNTVASTLFTTPGWTVSYEDGATITDKITFSVEGENYLRVADYLRQYVRGWFRKQGDTEIRFGKFTSTTPVLTFVAFRPTLGTVPSSQALITGLTRTRQGGEVVNRVYAVGGGVGETKIDLRHATRVATTSTPYSVTSSTIGTGVAGYYLEDTSSQATYGQVDRVVAWNEIRPITNSLADLQNAGNALYDIAAAYLKKYKSENDAYSLTAVSVPSTLRVGDLVRIVYNGVAELESGNVGWINVANNFYVTDITRAFDASGESTATIGVAANGEAVIGDTEVLYDILQDVQTLKLRTQPTQTYFSKSSDTVYTGGNWWGGNPYSSDAFFIHRFGKEVLAVNEIYLEISVRQWFFQYGLSSSAAISSSYVVGGTAQNVGNTKETSTNTAKNNTGAGSTHNHAITLYGTPSTALFGLYWDNINGRIHVNGIAGNAVPYSETESTHTHDMQHSHWVSNWGSHTHAITFGSPTPDTVSLTPRIGLEYICGSSSGWIELDSTNTTLAQNTTGQTQSFGTFSFALDPIFNKKGVEGYGNIRVNVTSVVNGTGVDWRNNDIRFTIKWSRGQAAINTQLYGRVTIQPIAV